MGSTIDGRGRTSAADRSGGNFDAVFLRYHAEVYRLLYRITGSVEESEDLAQEVFTRLYLHEFRPGREHSVRAWLYRVATNLGYNRVRDTNRRERRDRTASAQLSVPGNGSDDPASEAERRSEAQLVRRVLAALPERKARLLLLRYAGLSYQEVAEVLGVAPSSVGTMLARAEDAFERAFRDVGRSTEGSARDEL